MYCQFCRQRFETLVYIRFYSRKGVRVCAECQRLVEQSKHKPYSKVMEKLAVLEAGYKINRKMAKP